MNPLALKALSIADGCPDEFLARMAQLSALRDHLHSRRKLEPHQRRAISSVADAYGKLAVRLFELNQALVTTSAPAASEGSGHL